MSDQYNHDQEQLARGQVRSSEQHMTLFEHLAEFRNRLVYSAYGLVVGIGAGWGLSDRIFNLLRKPIEPYLTTGGLIYTGPMDKFVAHLKLAFVFGVVASCPYWLFHVWRFIAPGLYKSERKYAMGFIVAGTGLFALGVSFAYFIALPMAFKFLMTFGGDTDKPMIAIEEYLSFVSGTCLAFGGSFEMPLVLVTLGMLGLISKKFLQDKRRYAYLIIGIIAAIVTPPDALSMLMLMVPLLILFEASILIIGLFEARRQAV
ncbi:MAG TPA: twin-arginine translocase subunit TatC [Pseudobdellovibrionaceae bacterium]|nr:twin-arginine translocase subunit TatC [Pseudobdellovibrionaceae bacterium]